MRPSASSAGSSTREPLLPLYEESDARDRSPWRSRSWRDLFRDSLALLLGPAVSVPFASCYAALVCRLPQLQPYFPQVLQQVMWTQFAGAVLSLFLGQFVTTNNMDPLVAILIGQLARRIAASFTDAEALYLNMVLVIPVVTFCLGLVLYAVGRFRLASMLRFIPYTVVGGFLAGSGILILQESLALAAGTEVPSLVIRTIFGNSDLSTELDLDYDDGSPTLDVGAAWAQAALSIVYSELMRYARGAHTFGTPIVLMVSVLASMLVNRVSEGTVPPADWYLEFPGAVSWWAPFDGLVRGFTKFQPSAFTNCFELITSFISIMTVSWSVNVLAIAKLVPLKPGHLRCEEQGEIRHLGLSNMILGIFGGHASMQSFKIPMMMREVGAGPTWPLFNMVASFVFLVASPRLVVLNVPRFIFAGNVVRLSCDLILEWLIEARGRIAKKEWYVLLLSALVTVINVNVGVILGLFLTLILFAMEYSSITGVTRTGSLKDVRSMIERNEVERATLDEYGHTVQIVWLNGYLFFGSATSVADEVRDLACRETVLVIVLDFSHVPAMDASGVYAFMDLVDELKGLSHQPQVVLCGLVRRLENALRHAAENRHSAAIMKHDLDSSLEWCEAELFAALEKRGYRPRKTIKPPMPRIDSLGQVAGIADADEDTFEAIWGHLCDKELCELDPDRSTVSMLRKIVTVRKVPAGTVIFTYGEPATELFVLVTGSLEVTQPATHKADGPQVHLPRHHLNHEKGDVYVFEEPRPRRVRRARRGAVFGAVEYAANGQEARIHGSTGTAVGDSEVFVLPFQDLHLQEKAHPQLALVLRTWLSRLVADALLAAAGTQPHPDVGKGSPEPCTRRPRRSSTK